MRTSPGRWPAACVLVLATLAVYSPYLTDRLVTGNVDRDAVAYLAVLADACEQARQGVFPVYVGQSELRYNGGLYPQAQAPLFTLAGPVLDALTARALPATALVNLVIVASALGGALGMFAVLLRVTPPAPWPAAGLAFAYASCPGVLGVLFRLDMVTSLLALPLLPWLWHALLRAWEGHEVRAGVTLGLVAALLWAAHPPVALWATTTAAWVGVCGFALTRRGARAALVGAGAFAAAAAWPLATLFALTGGRAGKVGIDAIGARLSSETLAHVLASVRGDFPAALLPVGWVRGHPVGGWPVAGHEAAFVPAAWRDGAVLPYLQLGYALWAALGLAVAVSVAAIARRPRHGDGKRAGSAGDAGAHAPLDRRLVGLLCGAVFVIVFLLPVPGLTAWLWAHLPGAFDVTKWWPMQRLYLVLASLAAPLGMLAWSAWSKPAGSRGRRANAAGLVAVALVAWSAREAAKFTAFGFGRRAQGPEVARPENLPLRAKDLQMSAPRVLPEFSDPVLHLRMIDGAGRVWADNLGVARAACQRAPPLATLPEDVTIGRVELAPGRRLLLCVRDPPAGLLEAYGSDLYRNLRLGAGAAAPARAGVASPADDTRIDGAPLDLLPLFTTAAEPAAVHVRLTSATGARVRLDDGSVTVASYGVDALPVRVESWVPLRVVVTVDAGTRAGAAAEVAPGARLWLETPRQFVPGYRARVDGREAPAERSPDGLVAVALEPGRHAVELAYVGPAVVRATFPLSLAAWLLAAGGLAWSRRRS